MSESYIDRMKTELAELQKRHEALGNFISLMDELNNVDPVDKILLISQYSAMGSYKDVLALRLRRNT